MTNILAEWAALWGVPPEALHDLQQRTVMAAAADIDRLTGKSEAHVQSMIRLAAPAAGFVLWRNNVGALRDKDYRVVRYGLANDSAALNAAIKSGDLIGWRSEVIRPDMVGQTFARFVSVECKEGDWQWSGDQHEQAQMHWANLVNAAGGLAAFSTGELPK